MAPKLSGHGGRRVTGDRLAITLVPFGSLTSANQRQLHDRAERIAAIRRTRHVDVTVDS